MEYFGIAPVSIGQFLSLATHGDGTGLFYWSAGVGISVSSQSAIALPPETVLLPRWVLVEPDDGKGRGILNLDVVDGPNVNGRSEEEAIFLFTSSWAARRFIESDDGTIELHLFTPHEHNLQELFNLMERSRFLETPIMYGVIDTDNIHPGQGLRSFLLSAALVELNAALMSGTDDDVFIETTYVVNF